MQKFGVRTIRAVAPLSSRLSQQAFERRHRPAEFSPVSLRIAFSTSSSCVLAWPDSGCRLGTSVAFSLRFLSAEEGVERPVERGLHRYLVSRNHDDVLELGIFIPSAVRHTGSPAFKLQ